ncbi:hypothetical protein DRO59_07045 [Candidatus Bathyarchaeota archaeon]|nr:MAG: hypothetical protein DRO59_07045 [Candidatus Bathyarchaeota archaeon]
MSTFAVWDKEDIEHSEDIKREFKGAEFVVEFPARLRVAPCGCWLCEVVTPFGRVTLATHKCGQHM